MIFSCRWFIFTKEVFVVLFFPLNANKGCLKSVLMCCTYRTHVDYKNCSLTHNKCDLNSLLNFICVKLSKHKILEF